MKFTTTTNHNRTKHTIIKTTDLKSTEIIVTQSDDIIECYAALGADISLLTTKQKNAIRTAAAK